MTTPSSPLYSDASMDFSSYQSPRRGRIDYTKFKTKMCRNFLNGVHCPFENRCVFSHGDGVELHSPQSSTALSPMSQRYSRGLGSHGDGLDLMGGVDDFLSGSVDHENSDSLSEPFVSGSMALPPPPSYEAAIKDEMCSMNFTAEDEFGSLPPAYPTRYRYDPYSLSGITYEQ